MQRSRSAGSCAGSQRCLRATPSMAASRDSSHSCRAGRYRAVRRSDAGAERLAGRDAAPRRAQTPSVPSVASSGSRPAARTARVRAPRSLRHRLRRATRRRVRGPSASLAPDCDARAFGEQRLGFAAAWRRAHRARSRNARAGRGAHRDRAAADSNSVRSASSARHVAAGSGDPATPRPQACRSVEQSRAGSAAHERLEFAAGRERRPAVRRARAAIARAPIWPLM